MATADFPIHAITIDGIEYLAEPLTGERQVRPKILSGIIIEIRQYLQQQQEGTLDVAGYRSYLRIEAVDQNYYLLRDQSGARQPLKQYLEEQQPEVGQVCGWLARLVQIYQAAEDMGMEWDGIVPESIWIDPQGQLEVVDPYLTRLVKNYRDEVQLPWLEEVFLPPEVIQRKGWTAQGRMYALGVLIYHLLCGSSPFATTANTADLLEEIQEGRWIEPRVANPQLSPALNHLLQKLLVKSPDQRFGSWAEVLQAVQVINEEQDYRGTESEVREYQHKKEKIYRQHQRMSGSRRFFKRYWKTMTVGVVLIALLAFTLMQRTSPALPTITSDTPHQEVVEYYYQGIQARNSQLIELVADPQRVQQVTNWLDQIYALEKVSSAYSQSNGLPLPNPNPDQDSTSSEQEAVQELTFSSQQLFSLQHVQFELMGDGNEPVYRVTYQLEIRTPEGVKVSDREDRIYLKRIDGAWKIVGLVTQLGQ